MDDVSAITFDIDWAPDWCIDLCARIVSDNGLKATFFVTHRSAALDRLKASPNIEVGIHPNFFPGSTHGTGLDAVMAHVLDLVPGASSVRVHGLNQWSNFYAALANNYPGIETDVSTFFPGLTDYRPSRFFIEGMKRPITRLMFQWEDDIAAANGFGWGAPTFAGGVNIFNFHPIHIGLNMERMGRYRDMQASLAGKPLCDLSEASAAPFINAGAGAATFLRTLCRTIDPARCVTISEATHRTR